MSQYKCPYMDTDERCNWKTRDCEHPNNLNKCDCYTRNFGKHARTRSKAFWIFDEKKDLLSLEQLKKIIKIMEE